MYDLLLKEGKVFDPGQNLEGEVRDIALNDEKIVSVAQDISPNNAQQVLNLKGKLVMPGLIDLHTHVYWGATFLGIKPDSQIPQGVTTNVDAGSAGASNFLGLKKHIKDRAKTNVFAFLHIAYGGINGAIYRPENFSIVGEMEDLRNGLIEPAVKVGREYSDSIVGIKVRASREASGDQGLEPVRLAISAAEQLGKTVMVHVGSPPPTVTEILSILREGDILTHAFRGNPNSLIPDGKGKIRPTAMEARQRGVLFDVAHGGGSFSFQVARELLHRNFQPDIISSDLHKRCIDGPSYSLLTTMSKMLNLGMEIKDIIERATWQPAKAIGFEDTLGTLEENTVADISILEIENGNFKFYDGSDDKLEGEAKFNPVHTIIAGKLLQSESDENQKI